MRVTGVADGASLTPGLVAEVAVNASILSDPRLRYERVSTILNSDDHMADTALIRGGQDHVTDTEATSGGEVRVCPGDLIEAARLQSGTHVPGPVVVDLR